MGELKTPGRKIPLGDAYCQFTGCSSGGREDCDHDFDPKPTREYPSWAEWTCTRCGMRRRYEVYD
jgi:hypothetical protein